MYARLMEFFAKWALPELTGPGLTEPGWHCSCGWSVAGLWEDTRPLMVEHLKTSHDTKEFVKVQYLDQEGRYLDA